MASLRRIPGRAGALLLLAAPMLGAQDPVTLPGVRVTDSTLKPGPRRLIGIVVDTLGRVVPGAEVTIPILARRTVAREDGTFLFDSIPKGTYSMRARKLGYAPQVREFKVDTAGGSAQFALMPLSRALPPVVRTAVRGGLSGVVGDTSQRAIAGATVRILGNGMVTQTDASGAFFLPAKSGRYMVSISKENFTTRLVSVRIPDDSGRDILAWLEPGGKVAVQQAWVIDDLRERQAWVLPHRRVIYTHEDLERMKIEFIYDAVQQNWSKFPTQGPYTRDCAAVVNGGPGIATLNALTVDEVESVEIYGGFGGSPTVGAATRGKTKTTTAKFVGWNNTRDATWWNRTRDCPAVYVWLR